MMQKAVLLGLVFVFLSVCLTPNGEASVVRWPTLTLLYHIDSECYRGNGFLIFVAPILDAMTAWETWVPRLNFVAVGMNESVQFTCYWAWSMSSGSFADTLLVWNIPGNFTHAQVRLSLDSMSPRHGLTGGKNVVIHELGHIMGLSDEDWSTVRLPCTVTTSTTVQETGRALRIRKDIMEYANATCFLDSWRIAGPTTKMLKTIELIYPETKISATNASERLPEDTVLTAWKRTPSVIKDVIWMTGMTLNYVDWFCSTYQCSTSH